MSNYIRSKKILELRRRRGAVWTVVMRLSLDQSDPALGKLAENFMKEARLREARGLPPCEKNLSEFADEFEKLYLTTIKT